MNITEHINFEKEIVKEQVRQQLHNFYTSQPIHILFNFRRRFSKTIFNGIPPIKNIAQGVRFIYADVTYVITDVIGENVNIELW